MPSTSSIPNSIDRNAGSANRQRRNWQRLANGAATGTIKTTAPITGGSTVGLSFLTTSGLGLTGSALAILFADVSIVGSASGIKVQLASSSALSTTASGLKVLIDGSTITLNSTGQLQASTAGGGGSGTVTSVGLSLPSTVFTVSGSPVTVSGTLGATFATQASTLVFAGPSIGAAGVPTFRPLASTDIPALPYVSTAAGATTNVQFNSTGIFAGSSTFTTDGLGNIAITGQMTCGVQALVDGSTIAWNLSLGPFALVTLGGNRALANPTNIMPGGTYILRVSQDSTGGRTLSYGSTFHWCNSTAPVLTSTANAVDILTFVAFTSTTLYGVAQPNFPA